MLLKLDELLFCLPRPYPFLLIVLVMGLLGFIAYKNKHLTFSGAVGAALTGVAVLWCTRFEGFFVLLFFYCSSYLVAFWTKKQGADCYESEKKGAKRDLMQVMANGFACVIFSLIYTSTYKMVYLVAFGCALAEAAADTWAGDIGRLSNTPPVSIRTLKPVYKGTSGGVTPLGLAGGLAGSAAVAGFWQWAFGYETKGLWLAAALIIVCGFLGCVLDSFLGATVQAMFEDSRTGALTEKDTDQAGNPQKLVRGFRWMDNDIVNLICTIFSGLLGLGAFLLFV